MHRESKAELTDRLRREGRFEEFKKRREQLKAAGNEAKDAWFIAAAEFPQSSDPTGSAAIIEPSIRWSAKTCRALHHAHSDAEWLLLAMNVRLPTWIKEVMPERYAMLMELRANAGLRADFHRLLLKRLAERKHCFQSSYV